MSDSTPPVTPPPVNAPPSLPPGEKKGMSGCKIAAIVGACVMVPFLLITIIAVLASIAVPAYNGIAVRAEQTKEISNLKQIGLAMKIYAIDHDGKAPNSIEELEDLDFLPDEQAQNILYDRNTGERKAYEYHLQGGEIIDDLPPEQPIITYTMGDGEVIELTADIGARVVKDEP